MFSGRPAQETALSAQQVSVTTKDPMRNKKLRLFSSMTRHAQPPCPVPARDLTVPAMANNHVVKGRRPDRDIPLWLFGFLR